MQTESKDYFKFKQFSIYQNGVTLKVCTDSCLFGAWVASKGQTANILDIGTGTGLLALMYLQKNTGSKIIGLEVDSDSTVIAKHNCSASRWSKAIEILNISLQDFCISNHKRFQTIICNPPFFENQLKSNNKTKNLAKHSSHLSREALVNGINQLLEDKGEAFLLLPPAEGNILINVAEEAGLFLTEVMIVRNYQEKEPFRWMMKLERESKQLHQDEIFIYKSDKEYSDNFKSLLKDYYLYL